MNYVVLLITGCLIQLVSLPAGAQDSLAARSYLADLARFNGLLTGDGSFHFEMRVTVTENGEAAPEELVAVDRRDGDMRIEHGSLLEIIVDSIVVSVDESQRILSVHDTSGQRQAGSVGPLAQMGAELAPYASLVEETKTSRTYRFALAGFMGLELYEATYDKQGGFFPSSQLLFAAEPGETASDRIDVRSELREASATVSISYVPFLERCASGALCPTEAYRDYRFLSTRPDLAHAYDSSESQ